MAFRRQSCLIIGRGLNSFGYTTVFSFHELSRGKSIPRLRKLNNLRHTPHVCKCATVGLNLHMVHYSQQGPSSTEIPLQKNLKKSAESAEGTDGETDGEQAIRYTTSKASSWSVEESFGKQYKKPPRVVVPVCLCVTLFLAWAIFRSEGEIDRQLEAALTERLPGKFPEQQLHQFQPLPDWTKPLKEEGVKGDK